MIKKNLGFVERIVRLVLGVSLVVWLYIQPSFGLLQWGTSVIALFLILNALYARCYLWSWLGIDSASTEGRACEKETSQ